MLVVPFRLLPTAISPDTAIAQFTRCSFAQVSESASFTQDLGLDSLDAVEVVLAVEEEFSIEIPDEEVRLSFTFATLP